mgnify:CR=1 FL=1
MEQQEIKDLINQAVADLRHKELGQLRQEIESLKNQLQRFFIHNHNGVNSAKIDLRDVKGEYQLKYNRSSS